jgi:hypothetical protein
MNLTNPQSIVQEIEGVDAPTVSPSVAGLTVCDRSGAVFCRAPRKVRGLEGVTDQGHLTHYDAVVSINPEGTLKQ